MISRRSISFELFTKKSYIKKYIYIKNQKTILLLITLIIVTINTSPGTGQFKGILLLARRVDTNDVIGSWSATDATNFQTVTCGQTDSAITHRNRLGKALTTSFLWTAPTLGNGDVYIA